MDRYYFLIITLISLLTLGNLLTAQEIDSRRWSISYWQKLAEKGLVEVAKETTVPDAVYTGSKIIARTVLVDDSPDVPVINQTDVTQSENSIFVNPLDNDKALNSNNSTNFPVSILYGTSGFFTTDGGSTWGGSVQGTGGSNSGDPAACIDLTGRYYVGYISSSGGQGVARSTNEGQTWTAATVSSSFSDDKNHLWVDNRPSSPYAGYLYDTWTDFNFNDIVLSRSTNGGVNWSAPINISSAVASGSHDQGVNIQTGPNGEVYAVWAIYDSWPADENAMGFAKSTDGGATFAPATRIISNIRGVRISETSKNHRVASFPSMAVDISGGSRDGWIYIVWPNIGVPGTNNGPDIDVYMIRSTDGGQTWSTPSKVNQDPSGLGKEHYNSWITCDPETGALSAIFYDDRNVSSTQCEVFVANSLDGGVTWEDFKVSDVAFTPAPIPGLAGGYMGDYLGISARGAKVYPCWTDNRSGNALTYVSPFTLADPNDPNPPDNGTIYSDYTTPTSMQLDWSDPTTYTNGDTLLPANFTIEIYRDEVPLTSVSSGVEQYTDNGLNDGQKYKYTLYTKDVFDSLSLPVNLTWYAGGSPFPAAPQNLAATTDTAEAVLTWDDPTTQADGTPLDDLDHINVYRDGALISSVPAGTQTHTDTPPPGFVYTYTVTAVDNETPPNESSSSNEASGFVGTTPDMLVWVGPGAVGSSAASGDSLYEALLANGESTFLTNDLFEFGPDLSIYQAVFVVLGIYADNHVLGSSDPEAAALETYLQNGGRLFLEGGDCFNYDPENGGYNIRPWFDLDDGPDGSADVFGVIGLNDLSAFSFTYSDANNFMDELHPFNSTPVWQNNANSDISGVFNVYGSARTIGVVPSFGGFDNSSAALNESLRTARNSSKTVVKDVPKERIRRERNENFVKKAGYYPELKKNRKSDREYFEITTNGVHILANTKDDLMAAYLAYFHATPGSPVIALSDTVFNDTLLVGDTATETLTITNSSGTLGGELTYSISENPEVTWLSVIPVSGTLTANQSEDIALSIDASGLTAGDYTTTLDIASNDPANPLVNSVVNLQVNAAPAIRVEPDTVQMTVDAGTVDSTIFTIHNDGAGPLQVYSIEDEEINASGKRRLLYHQEQRPVVHHPKGEEPPSDGSQQTEGAGGPDPFGYKWIDSDEPGGPPYVYTDISGTGTVANLQPTGIFDPKDEGQATVTLPWDVKFYGNSYDQLQVCSNGFITFDLVFFDVSYVNTPIPEISDPNLIVGPLWDDLDGSAAGATREIYYQQVGNKFIIQWHNWGYYPAGTENLDFQIVFFQNSSTIWFAYENVVDQGLATYGIENVDGTVGLQIAYNELYAHNQLLTKITLGAEWLTQTPGSGTVAPGDSLEITLKADASFLSAGSYLARILIDSNDPLNATLGEPVVNLQVSGGAAISVSPASLDFDTTKVGQDTTLSLTIENIGGDTLEVNNILITNAAFSADTLSFMVPPSEMQEVQVTFAPLTPGSYSGMLRIVSNDPMNDTLNVALSGYGAQVTGITSGGELPRSFAVSPNYPNPFNPSTTIKYQLPQNSDVKLMIYNVLGQAVRTLVDARIEAGYHSVEWDGRNDAGAQVASGIYIYRFSAENYLKVQKMILMK